MDNIYFITQNNGIKRILDFIDKVYIISSKIFITGEVGTGKVHLVNYLINKGGEYSNPFIYVPTITLNSDNFEDELLGCYSSNTKSFQKGYFEMANGGTLFINNIDCLSMRNQTLLLDVLEKHQIIRPKTKEIVNIDFRFICTTSKDIEESIKTGDFREDLYFVLESLKINLPPLRERIEDINLLVKYFLNDIQKKIHPKINYTIENEAIDIFKEYTWPGNVQELKNELERICIMFDGKVCINTISPHILKPKISHIIKSSKTESITYSDGSVLFKPHWKGRGFKTDRNYCFVLMPFSEKWSNEVWNIIKDTVTEMGFSCERADDKGGRVIMEDIWESINTSNLIIADLTSRNPNVAYEVGMSDVIGKEIIFLTQEINNIPFDFLGQRLIVYNNSMAGAKMLREEIQRRIKLLFPRL